MNFISWAFVLLLIPVMAARLTIGRRHTEKSFLFIVLVASTIFVCWYVPIYILVLLASLSVDYVAAIGVYRFSNSFTRKLILSASLAVNLLLLVFFKYAFFFLSQINRGLSLLHWPALGTHYGSVALPIGISFYTFGSMSYTIDVYRGKFKPVRNFARFYFFLSFFPHMVAGPIIRANQFFYQMARRRRLHLRVFNQGAFLIIRGAFLKMVCADNIAPVVNGNWASGYQAGNSSGSNAVLAILFAVQIFCDFEGYCSIARGLAYWLGFRFPINFNNPYLAGSFSHFWERWHITLSQWLRDYLYIPLGGNRKSRLRTCINVMIVLILGGLWHGPAMTFVVWGILHGTALVIERLLGLHGSEFQSKSGITRLLWYGVVQVTVLIGWVIFRSDSVHHAVDFLFNTFSFKIIPIDHSNLYACMFAIPVLIMHLHGYLAETETIRRVGGYGQAIIAAVMLFLVMTFYGHSSEFIYFQF